VKAIAEALGTEEAPRSFRETPGEPAEARIDTTRLIKLTLRHSSLSRVFDEDDSWQDTCVRSSTAEEV
jgi:hypothetical protein